MNRTAKSDASISKISDNYIKNIDCRAQVNIKATVAVAILGANWDGNCGLS